MIPQTVVDFLEKPPVEWEQILDSEYEWIPAAGMLEFIGIRALLLSCYISVRLGHDGCGQKEHADAAKAVATLHRKLRKTLGYTMPERGVLHL